MKKWKQAIWLVLVLAFVLALVAGLQAGDAPLSQVQNLLVDNGFVYGVNRTEEDFQLFQSTMDGELVGQIQLPITKDDTAYHLAGWTLDGTTVYALVQETDMVTGTYLGEALYSCDFSVETLDFYYELPVLSPQQVTNLGVTVHDGTVFCVQTNYEGKTAEATVYKGEIGQTLDFLTKFEYDIGIGFTDFYVDTTGEVLFTTPVGEAYTLLADNTLILRHSGEQIAHMTADQGGNVRLVTRGGDVFQLTVDGESPSQAISHLQVTENPDMAVTSYTFNEAGQIALVKNSNRVVVYTDQGLQIADFDTLTQPTAHQWQVGLMVFFGILIAVGILTFLAYGLYRLMGKKIPIVTKLLAVFLPVLAVGLTLTSGVVTHLFTQQLTDNQYERLFLLTQQQTATLNEAYLEEISLENPHDSVYFYQLRAAMNLLPTGGTLVDEDGELQEVYHDTYFWLYKLEGGILYSLICEQDYIAVPVEQRYDWEIAAQFYRAVVNKTTLRTTFADSYGQWTVLITPIYNQAGDVVGVMETGDQATSLHYAVAQGAKNLWTLHLAVMVLLIGLLTGVIVYSLYPLGRLKRTVNRIAEGDLGVQTTVHGHDEVAEISQVVNRMSYNVAYRDREIRATSEGYSRFVPAEVFQLLDKSSVIDVELADQTYVDGVILGCGVSSFDQAVRAMDAKEMFTFINQILEEMVPTVEATGGMVDTFDKAGLVAIYTKGGAGALDAAIALRRNLRTTQLERDLGGDFHGVISAGPAMIGIVGAKERLEAMTISEHSCFARFLRPLAVAQGAHILITDSAARKIPNFHTAYHSRLLGYVRMHTLETVERIYDVYDGSDESTYACKELTKATFEKGVELYCTGAFYDARLLFIEVLKQHRQDKAAQKYLYLCDQAYHEDKEQDICIATY
ncbi:MAG: HAMP domain-containing protein [Eubacteriales bacterium]